jgi:hypothetical protein
MPCNWGGPASTNGHTGPLDVDRCAGRAPVAVQTLLGQASIATTERYVAVDDSEIRAAMLSAL